MRRRYRLVVLGYVVMPEHVHLLLSEPQRETLSTAIQALKLGFVRSLGCSRRKSILTIPCLAKEARHGGTPDNRPEQNSTRFWQVRFYDFNVWTEKKED